MDPYLEGLTDEDEDDCAEDECCPECCDHYYDGWDDDDSYEHDDADLELCDCPECDSW
jgi:hypothetical protein